MSPSSLINEMTRSDYPQPNCPVCGRFAARTPHLSWRFTCNCDYDTP